MVLLGEDRFRYDPAHYLITTMELPLVGEVIHVSPEQPYSGVCLVLDPTIVTSDPSPHETGRQAVDYYELAVKGIAGAAGFKFHISQNADTVSETRRFAYGQAKGRQTRTE